MTVQTYSLAQPLSPDLTVLQGRDAYLAENGFTLDAYDAPRVPIALLGTTFMLPNPESRQRAVRWHDLHHVATGYGTDPAGEGEISAWELRRGLAGLNWYVRGIVRSGGALGLLVAPVRTRDAWRASGRGGPTNLFGRDLADYDSILAMTIGELRHMLAVPARGLAERPRGLHAAAPR